MAQPQSKNRPRSTVPPYRRSEHSSFPVQKRQSATEIVPRTRRKKGTVQLALHRVYGGVFAPMVKCDKLCGEAHKSTRSQALMRFEKSRYHRTGNSNPSNLWTSKKSQAQLDERRNNGAAMMCAICIGGNPKDKTATTSIADFLRFSVAGHHFSGAFGKKVEIMMLVN